MLVLGLLISRQWKHRAFFSLTVCEAQYQLWIVDPQRDADSPVDGGVFDIPTDGSPVVIPINAKLALSDPKAFLMTLEKSGGVVKSKREKEVALAKI